jgi:hypothetical protein
MKILRFEPSELFDKRFTINFDFDSAAGLLSGSVGSKGENDDLLRDFSIDLNRWKGKIVEVVVMATNLGLEVCCFDALKNYSMGNGMPTGYQDKQYEGLRLFRVVVHENIEDSLIQLRYAHEEIEGFENIIEDGDKSLAMFNLAKRDKVAEKIIRLARLKSDMLGVIDQRDSVSYLEAQVDILTRLVLALHPEDNSLVRTLREADEHSVLAIKGEESLSKEFTKKKAWVRSVQKDYYEAKKELEEALA